MATGTFIEQKYLLTGSSACATCGGGTKATGRRPLRVTSARSPNGRWRTVQRGAHQGQWRGAVKSRAIVQEAKLLVEIEMLLIFLIL